ncbi:Fc.00g040510.m01.CDS01 [Cosmosporella sp. VM-42]
MLPLPCEYAEASLVSIGSQQDPLDNSSGPATAAANVAPKPLHTQRATMLYLPNDGDDSFIEVNFVRSLFRAKRGPDVPIPHIDNDTRVTIQWHFLPLDKIEVTRHRVLRNSRYQIILRKQDWEPPIRHWLQREYEQLHQQRQREAIALVHQAQQNDHKTCRMSKSGTPLQPSDQPQESTPPPSPAPSACGHDSEHEADMEWSEVEITELDASNESAQEEDSKSFWIWSREHQRFFHENEDQSIVWFHNLD